MEWKTILTKNRLNIIFSSLLIILILTGLLKIISHGTTIQETPPRFKMDEENISFLFIDDYPSLFSYRSDYLTTLVGSTFYSFKSNDDVNRTMSLARIHLSQDYSRIINYTEFPSILDYSRTYHGFAVNSSHYWLMSYYNYSVPEYMTFRNETFTSYNFNLLGFSLNGSLFLNVTIPATTLFTETLLISMIDYHPIPFSRLPIPSRISYWNGQLIITLGQHLNFGFVVLDTTTLEVRSRISFNFLHKRARNNMTFYNNYESLRNRYRLFFSSKVDYQGVIWGYIKEYEGGHRTKERIAMGVNISDLAVEKVIDLSLTNEWGDLSSYEQINSTYSYTLRYFYDEYQLDIYPFFYPFYVGFNQTIIRPIKTYTYFYFIIALGIYPTQTYSYDLLPWNDLTPIFLGIGIAAISIIVTYRFYPGKGDDS